MPSPGDNAPSTQARPVQPAPDPRSERLDALRAALAAATELRARVVSQARSGTGTTLYVTNPHVGGLSEHIGCDLRDGEWWFTWPLNNSGILGLAADIDGAVKVISRVLAVRM